MRRIIVFAREPEAGKVKTRLKRHLTSRERVSLYKAFLRDALESARAVDCEERVIAYESSARPMFIKRVSKRLFSLNKQRGRDLGERMYNAFTSVKFHKADKTIIIGSDSPTLPPRIINKAFKMLDNSDVILGPSVDGGFYLIGVKRPSKSIFKDIEWSGPDVLVKTIGNSKIAGKRVGLLRPWWDIDTIDDLNRLIGYLKINRSSGVARWTRRAIKKITLKKVP